MKLIVGLGNPGRKYIKTRHNAGFMALDAFSRKNSIAIEKEKWNSFYGLGESNDEKYILAKPMTFMNRSGEAVAPMMNWWKIAPEDLIVICDDIHLPLGQLRIRMKGSEGGHNGLASIIEHIGTREFTRIRLGISEPPANFDQADYVLSKFTESEWPELEQMIGNAIAAVETMLIEGTSAAMNKHNARKINRTGEEQP